MRYLRYLLLLAPVIIIAACSPKVNQVKIVAVPDSGKIKPIVVQDPNFKPQVVVVPAGPFAKTDSVYTVKTDSLLGLARQQKPAMLMDTSGMAIPSNFV